MIVVTGGAGFIGSNLIAALNDQGMDDLVVCDRLSRPEKQRNLAKRSIRELIAPERLPAYLESHAAAIEVVFHLAGTSASNRIKAPLMIGQHLELSARLWDWAAGAGGRLIYASSAATYGDGAQGFDDDIAALSRLRPLSLYAWSKHLFDCQVASLHKVRAPAQWAGLKFFNVYGPNELHKGSRQSLVAQAFRSIMEDGCVRLFRSSRPDVQDGDQRRDFIAVDDCVRVMLWLREDPGVSGLFNVGTGEARTSNALAGAVFAATAKPERIEYIDMPPALSRHYPYHSQARIERLREAGYGGRFIALEDGVRAYVQNFLMAEDQYR